MILYSIIKGHASDLIETFSDLYENRVFKMYSNCLKNTDFKTFGIYPLLLYRILPIKLERVLHFYKYGPNLLPRPSRKCSLNRDEGEIICSATWSQFRCSRRTGLTFQAECN